MLIDAGASMELLDYRQRSPLITAVKARNHQVCLFVHLFWFQHTIPISNQANTNCHLSLSLSLFSFLSSLLLTQVVTCLLEKGARLETEDAFGHTALHYALEAEDEAISELLVSKGAQPNKVCSSATSSSICSSSNNNIEPITDSHSSVQASSNNNGLRSEGTSSGGSRSRGAVLCLSLIGLASAMFVLNKWHISIYSIDLYLFMYILRKPPSLPLLLCK